MALREYTGGIVSTVIIVGFIVVMGFTFHDDNVRAAKRAVETSKRWDAWLTYRDANCKVSERMYGLSETSGKFRQNDNATVYDCHGVKYVVAESVERAAKDGTLYESQIPAPEK